MTTSNRWKTLLNWWNTYLLDEDYNDTVAESHVPPDVIASRWLGYPGATEAQILEAERRLGSPLPPSYREFFKITNGWRVTTMGNDSPLWPVEEIDWLQRKQQHFIEACLARHNNPESYPLITTPGLTEEGHPVPMDQFQQTLQISSMTSNGIYDYTRGNIWIPQYFTSVYLLNPSIVTTNGEWEAWHFTTPFPGSRRPGAYRYASFYEMIEREWTDYPALH
jgi:hypothetical protein